MKIVGRYRFSRYCEGFCCFDFCWENKPFVFFEQRQSIQSLANRMNNRNHMSVGEWNVHEHASIPTRGL